MADLVLAVGAVLGAAWFGYKIMLPKQQRGRTGCAPSSSPPDEIALFLPLGIRKARHVHGPGAYYVYKMGEADFENTYVNARGAGLGQSIGYR
jgi:hypothetical protein